MTGRREMRGLDTGEDSRRMDIEIQMEALKAQRQERAKKR